MVDFYSVAGALSGLLAGVITEYLDGARGIAGWRWLFVSLCFGIVETFLEIFHSMYRLSMVAAHPFSDACRGSSWLAHLKCDE